MAEGTPPRTQDDIRSRLVLPVGAVVTAVWASAAFFGLYSEDFLGLEIVTPLMAVFVGYVFGVNIVRTGEKSSSSTSASASPRTRR